MRWGLRLVALALPAAMAIAAPSASVATGVEAWDTSGPAPVRCAAIDVSDPRGATGGCSLEAVTGEPIRVRVRSMVGDLEFGNCVYPHTLRVDGSGRTAIDVRKVGGPRPCNDIRPCWSKRSQPFDNQPFLTWRGHLRANARGDLHNVVGVCLETCMGRFEGGVDIALEPVGASSRAEVARELLGSTGLELDGYWEVDTSGVDFRPSAASRSEVAASGLFSALGPSLGLGFGGGGDRRYR